MKWVSKSYNNLCVTSFSAAVYDIRTLCSIEEISNELLIIPFLNELHVWRAERAKRPIKENGISHMTTTTSIRERERESVCVCVCVCVCEREREREREKKVSKVQC